MSRATLEGINGGSLKNDVGVVASLSLLHQSHLKQSSQETQLCKEFEQNFAAWCTAEGVETSRHELETQRLGTKEKSAVLFGSLPSDLSGAWYRNGPGKFKLGDQEVVPLDADGFVVRVEFDEGSVFLGSRFVETGNYKKEASTGLIHRRGIFGTPASKENLSLVEKVLGPGIGIPRFKNTANTALIPTLKSMLALWEGGLPHEMNPETLETTQNESLLDGCLMSGDMFGAHPKVDPHTGHLFNTGANFEQKFRKHPFMDYLKIWELKAVGSERSGNRRFESVQKLNLKLARPYSIVHEVGLTKNFIVIPQSPVTMSIFKLGLGGSMSDSMESTDGDMFIYVVPKKQPEGYAGHRNKKKAHQAAHCLFRCPRSFSFHIVNCFERRNAKEGQIEIVVDLVTYEELPTLSDIVNVTFGKYNETPVERDLEAEMSSLKAQMARVVRFVLPLGKRVIREGWDGAACALNPDFFGQAEFLIGTPFQNAHFESSRDDSQPAFDLTGVEFPCINDRLQGRAYQYAYFVDMSLKALNVKHTCFASLLKLNVNTQRVERWIPPRDYATGTKLLLNEPCFAPNPSSVASMKEDEGYLLFSAFHGAQNPISSFFVVDAEKLETLCQFKLDVTIPVGIHTMYVESDKSCAEESDALEMRASTESLKKSKL